jgi:hypothetical protein
MHGFSLSLLCIGSLVTVWSVKKTKLSAELFSESLDVHAFPFISISIHHLPSHAPCCLNARVRGENRSKTGRRLAVETGEIALDSHSPKANLLTATVQRRSSSRGQPAWPAMHGEQS